MKRIEGKMYGFYLPEKMMAEFQAVAVQQGLNQSSLLRTLAVREIRRHKKEIADSKK